MKQPPETFENFLPEQDFYYFATEAMRFPHYIPCDFTANKKESDGSIDTLGNNLKTVDVKKHEVMFQAMIFDRFNSLSLSTDFYAKNEQFVTQLADLLNVKKWWLLRINCTIGQDKNYVGAFHNDFTTPYFYKNTTTAILYLNTNNGGTQFYNKDGPIIQSKANTLVKFPTNTTHAGVCATNAKLRFVLNLNYE